jgi:hypothetical protein
MGVKALTISASVMGKLERRFRPREHSVNVLLTGKYESCRFFIDEHFH